MIPKCTQAKHVHEVGINIQPKHLDACKRQKLLEFVLREMLIAFIKLRGLCILVVFCEPRLQGFVSINLRCVQFNAVQAEVERNFTLHIKHM